MFKVGQTLVDLLSFDQGSKTKLVVKRLTHREFVQLPVPVKHP
jgi:hypothetical protein